jgi:hypothetical protein
MSIKSIHSTKPTIREAVAEIKENLDKQAKLIVYFASVSYAPQELAAAISEAFPGVPAIGCSTAGEISTGKMLKNSIVALSLDSSVLEDVAIQIIDTIPNPAGIKAALGQFESYYKKKSNEFELNKYVGIVLIDGLSGAEEAFMESLGALSNIPFIGGSAGDDLKFAQTYIYGNGQVFTGAAVLALLKTVNGFEIIKTQSFRKMKNVLIATKVNELTREVIEFNNKPAVAEYASQLNVAPVNAADRFMHNPVGLVVDDEDIFVRSPQQAIGNSIKFYCSVKEGMELSLLESTDIIQDTRKAVEDCQRKQGPLQGLINFHCILRTLELEQKNLTEDYGRIFSALPTIGFSTYGEQYLGHINQTSTILAFK